MITSDLMDEPAKHELPETLQALRKLENSRNGSSLIDESKDKEQGVQTKTIEGIGETNASISQITNITNPVEPKKYFLKFIPWSGRLGIFFKVLTVLCGIVGSLLLLFALLTLTSIDLAIVKIGLSGQVLNSKGEVIEGASIILDEETATTDRNGHFYIPSLSAGRFEIEISADGYETFREEVPIARTFLDYTVDQVFVLTNSGIGSVSGKFVTDDTTYDFSDDYIEINGLDRYKISTDGTFLVQNLQTGDISFAFRSLNYADIQQDFYLANGSNTLADIELIAAGDIEVSTVSFVKEDIVTDLSVTMEGTTTEQITISDEGKLYIKDLEVGKEYALKIEHPKYEERTYNIKIAQGMNIIPEFKVVEKGRIPFIAEIEDKKYLVAADYDGSDQVTLSDENLEVYGEYAENKDIYFLTTRDKVRSDLGGYALLVYTVDAYTKEPTRVTSNYEDFGRIIPNFTAKKLANVREGTDKNHRALEIMNLNGNDRIEIYYTETGIFSDIAMSDSGNYVYFYVQDKDEVENGMYRGDMRTGQSKFLFDDSNIIIYDVSPSGDKVLYSTTDDDTGLTDLHIYMTSNGSDTVVRNAIKGAQYQFLTGSETTLLYFLNSSSGSNMYFLDTTSNAETQLTNYSGTEGVEAVYQEGEYIFYQTNKGLYIMSFSSPKRNKLVTTSIVRYTGYDF